MFSLAVADVNGDGHPDILTANQDADSVSVLLNDGTGGFEAPNGSYIGFRNGGIFLGAINSLYDAKMADLNGDGITDVAALEWPYTTAVPYTLDVLLGDSGGNFAVHKRSPVLDASIFVGDYAFGDFRGTGRPDFVSTAEYFSASPYLAFAKNNGDATFTALPITHPSGAQGVLGAGDFNGDGKLDLIVLGNSLTVFLGNGDGTFTTGFTSPFNIYYPFRLFVGDFNGDQKLDVLVRIYNNIAGRQGDNVYEFLGKGDGTFSTPTVVIPNCGVITVGDLNHDGRPDVVELAQPLTDEPIGTPPAYNVYLAQSDGSFQLTNTYQAYAGLNTRSVPTLADFNGDGNLDIPVFQFYPAFPNSATGWIYLQVLLGNGDGTFTPSYTTFDFHESAVPQFMADVTGDGKADLIELDGYTQSAHVIPAVSGQALQARLVSTPILGSQGTVRINLALASSSDTPLQLTASDSALTIPSSVTIPAGSASLDVPFQIGSNFNPNHVFTIAAALGTQTAVAYGWKTDSVNPVGFRLVLNNQSETIAASQATPDYGVYVNEVDGYATTVQLSCSGLPAWAVCQFGTPSMEMPPSTSGNSTLVVTTTSAASIGRYNFKVIATDGTVTDQVTATLQIGDFSMTITPGALTTGPSSSVNFTLTIGDYDGFTGSIALSASGLPSAATLTNLPSSAVAGTYDVTLQTQSVPVGNYLLTVTGTSGSITHSVSVAIQVQSQTPDFTISLSPGTQTTASTGSANYTLTIGAISGFTGNVTVSISGLPSGATVTNLSNSVGAGSYSLTVQTQSVPAGNYTFTITGTSGPLTHIASATLEVQGLSGSVSPTSATLSVGQSASFTVTVSSQYGATGAVSFQCSNVPSGSTCTFNPVSPTLPANGSLSDTLTVQVDSRPAAVPPATPPPWTNRGSLPRTPPPLAVLLMASILLGIVGRRPKLRPAATVLFLIGVASFFMATASCGGGGASSGSPPPPPVTFTITVQASVPGVSAAKTIGTLTITVN